MHDIVNEISKTIGFSQNNTVPKSCRLIRNCD